MLLHGQAYKENGPTTHGQPINPGVTPFPSCEDPATFPLSSRRRRSEPALNKLLWYRNNQKDWGWRADQRSHSSAAGPTIPLDRPVKRAPMDSTTCLRTMSAPSCMTTVCSDEGGTKNIPSHSSPLEGQSLWDRPDSNQGQRSGFRRWATRIGKCMRRLCCCLPSTRRPRLGQKRVSPQN